MSEKIAFAQACQRRDESIAEICDRFGISQKTGYKLWSRFRKEGIAGLEEQSRARITHPYRISAEVAERIISLRRKYPHYGAQIIHDLLVRIEPHRHWPAASSMVSSSNAKVSSNLERKDTLSASHRSRPEEPERTSLTSSGQLTSRESFVSDHEVHTAIH